MPIVQTIELPCDQMEEPFAVLPIKGLAVNATNPDLAHLSTGHLLFVREEPNGGTYRNKVRAATWVFTDVVVPFLVTRSCCGHRFGPKCVLPSPLLSARRHLPHIEAADPTLFESAEMVRRCCRGPASRCACGR